MQRRWELEGGYPPPAVRIGGERRPEPGGRGTGKEAGFGCRVLGRVGASQAGLKPHLSHLLTLQLGASRRTSLCLGLPTRRVGAAWHLLPGAPSGGRGRSVCRENQAPRRVRATRGTQALEGEGETKGKSRQFCPRRPLLTAACMHAIVSARPSLQGGPRFLVCRHCHWYKMERLRALWTDPKRGRDQLKPRPRPRCVSSTHHRASAQLQGAKFPPLPASREAW